MSAPNEEHSQDGDWGWEPLGSEDEEPTNSQGVLVNVKHDNDSMDADGKAAMSKRISSEKSLSAKRGSFSNQHKTLPGIVSSPSFLELEKAIGATLNLASNDSGDLSEGRLQSPSSGTFPPSKLSSTNLTQQKVNQQRLRQQQHQSQRYSTQSQYSRSPAAQSYGYGSAPSGYSMMPPAAATIHQSPSPPARVELAPYINESESRAIILFHAVHISTADIRNACSKYGVLYYIRPEFHSKGVTLISYFDLRAATSAKACIVEDLGRGAEASVHYSVMLHAANGNSEEFRLVARNLPAESCAEADVQAIFARYGQLRSIQKTFEDGEGGGGVSSEKGSDSGSPGSGGGRDGSEASAGDGSAAAAAAAAVCKIAYSIEYYNIQDARLAASELSATSAQLWNSDVTVNFAPLDERKQQLCRQLLATLSRWRTEMAALASSAAAAMSYSFNLQHQQQQQQHAHLQARQQQQLGMGTMGYGGLLVPQQQQQQGLGVGLGLGLGGGAAMGYSMGPIGMGQMGMGGALMDGGGNGNGNGASYFDPTNPFYQQQVYLQHQVAAHQQQQQQHGAGMTMPMSVQAMAGLMYAPPAASDGGSGSNGVGARASPMQSLMPANLSNPNLFNLGLLAAQAEAQMQQQQQQQQQQQMAMPPQPYFQQVQQQQQQDGVGGSVVDGHSDGGLHVAVQRPSAYSANQAQQQQQAYGPRHAQHNTVNGVSQRMYGSGRGGSVPPHHQNGGAYAVASYGNAGSVTAANMTTGGLNAPLHHHQQHHLQQHQQGHGWSGQQGMMLGGAHTQLHQQQQQQQQQQQRRGSGGNTGRGPQTTGQQQQQYGYPAYSGAGGTNGVPQQQQQQPQQDADFALDLKRIGDDVETRTTVMVRNIPNKYNQQMLLEEVNVGHEGTYDFFYLPIDFKNRCNVGYCFINFLDPKHIPPFVHAFNGQRWKSFNSEKVCAVTFARIQGKQAMISRFQNSSLLEKDDEYQPLLFYSTGPDRGKPEPFPVSSSARRALQHQQPAPGGSSAYHPQHYQQQQHPGTVQSPPPPSSSSASSSRSATPPPPPNSATPRSTPHQHMHAYHHQPHQPEEGDAALSGGKIAIESSTVAQEAGAA